MKSQLSNFKIRTVLLGLLLMSLSCVLAVWAQTPVKHSLLNTSVPEKQKSFPTPQLAAQALIKAAESYDVPALLEILGPDGKDLVESADPVRDKNIAEEFVQKAHEKTHVTVENTKATLVVGNDDWPLPVPIVMKQGQWHFDTKAGHDEILIRRIGENELDAIQIAHGYVEAQNEYMSTIHEGSTIHEYARKIISTPGKQDGLFWKNPDGSTGGPISENIARAIEQGYTDKSSPYHGYYFKILKGQGPNAPLGELDYEIHGAMIGGFALVAVPAEYRVTGVKTFLVNHYGTVYEKDLGPHSLEIVKAMDRFNPDKTWRPTKDEQ